MSLVAALSPGAGAQEPLAPVATDLNHVTTVTTEARAQGLYNALVGLELSSAWPFASYGAISSGGVRLGNLNVELGAGTSPYAGTQFATLQPPSLTGLTAALDARGIVHGQPIPVSSGSELLYTLVELPTYSQESRFTAQFCAYNIPDPDPSRKAPPNRAGLVRVSRVILNARRPSSWGKLLAPARVSPGGIYRLPGGPLVQVRKSSRNSIASIHAQVRNVARASRAFRAAGLATRGHTVSLGSLRLLLVAAR